jgi:hypothetical protein
MESSKEARVASLADQSCGHGALLRPYTYSLVGDALVDEFHDVLRRSAGKKNSRDADLFEFGDVGFGDDAAEQNGNVGHAFFLKQFHELRADRVVRARKN